MANNKLFKKASVNAIENLAKELAEAKLLSTHEPEWSTPIKFNERMPMGSCGIGLYKIIHKDGMITMYVGQGGVGARKNTHMRVFKNKGKMIKYGNTTWTKSEAASQMYEFDENIDNWLFSFCVIHNKSVSKEYEKLLIEAEEPLFNSDYMAGVN